MDSNIEIFNLHWHKFAKDVDSETSFLSTSTIFWKGIRIEIKILSFWGKDLGGFRSHFDFDVNGTKYNYKMLDTYAKGTYGKIPEIVFETQKLIIIPKPTSIEVFEQLI
jgi:hypothetical protein